MRFNPLTPKLSKISLNNNLNDNDDKLSLLFHIVQVNQASSDEEISLLARNATLVDGLLNAGWFHHLTMTKVDRKWGFWLIDLGNFRKLGQDF